MVIPARDSALASALAPVLALRRLPPPGSARNVALYPWFRLFKSLSFYQAVWFLYFQDTLSAAEAILLYAVYDVATTALEVPSGWMSDRLGRRLTLIASAVAGMAGAAVLAAGASFEAFVLGQVLMGASMAFASGTDSAFLYESLAAEGREGETEREEVRAWRFSFSALAVSAALGGALAMGAPALPYAVTALALGGALAIGLAFREPARGEAGCVPRTLRTSSLVAAFRQPVLAWLFVLGLVMYAFSHVPFVFGQPFILEALAGTALEGRETLASGAVTAVMMVVSVLASLVAPGLRRRVGLAAMLLAAFAMQVGLIGALALSEQAAAVALLFLRMVPDAWSRPFMLARMQPLLGDRNRATFLSLQSFCGRLGFAVTLWLAAGGAGTGRMDFGGLQAVLGAYALGGIVLLATLAVAASRIDIDRRTAT